MQSTFLIPGGYLLPDLTLVEPLSRSEQQWTARLVVEVAETSQARDREKSADYARACVPDYWLVDLPGRTVTVYREPAPAGFARIDSYGDGTTIVALAVKDGRVDVTELLG